MVSSDLVGRVMVTMATSKQVFQSGLLNAGWVKENGFADAISNSLRHITSLQTSSSVNEK